MEPKSISLIDTQLVTNLFLLKADFIVDDLLFVGNVIKKNYILFKFVNFKISERMLN